MTRHRQRDAIGGKTKRLGFQLTKWNGVAFLHYPAPAARLPKRGKLAVSIKKRP
jgi:hypothetical protein